MDATIKWVLNLRTELSMEECLVFDELWMRVRRYGLEYEVCMTMRGLYSPNESIIQQLSDSMYEWDL